MSNQEKKRGRPKGKDKELSKKTIIDCAKSLMKTNRKMPSIRQMAGVLDVDAMAIYYYFENKNALLEAMAITLVSEIYNPIEVESWEDELLLLCKSYLNLLNEYSGLLEIMLSMKSISPAKVFTDKFNKIVLPLDLDHEQKKNALDLLVDYLHGVALAMKCNPDLEQLNVDTIDGPIKLYIKALIA
jgi:AcrR family transcriptional regulator